jgi:hypothetical protein
MSTNTPVALCVIQYVLHGCALGNETRRHLLRAGGINSACCYVNASSTLRRLSHNTQLPEKLPTCNSRGVRVLRRATLGNIWLYSWHNALELSDRNELLLLLLSQLLFIEIYVPKHIYGQFRNRTQSNEISFISYKQNYWCTLFPG